MPAGEPGLPEPLRGGAPARVQRAEGRDRRAKRRARSRPSGLRGRNHHHRPDLVRPARAHPGPRPAGAARRHRVHLLPPARRRGQGDPRRHRLQGPHDRDRGPRAGRAGARPAARDLPPERRRHRGLRRGGHHPRAEPGGGAPARGRPQGGAAGGVGERLRPARHGRSGPAPVGHPSPPRAQGRAGRECALDGAPAGLLRAHPHRHRLAAAACRRLARGSGGHHPGRDGAPAARRGPAAPERDHPAPLRRSPGAASHQGRIPGHGVPRAAHAPAGDPGLGAPAAGDGRGPRAADARTRDHRAQRPRPGQARRRHPRRITPRVGHSAPGLEAGGPRRDRAHGGGRLQGAGLRQGSGSLPRPPRPSGRGGRRRDPLAADRLERPFQCPQVHTGRPPGGRAPARGGGPGRPPRRRLGHRDRSGVPSPRLRPLPAGGQFDHASPRWPGPRARPREPPRRDARGQRGGAQRRQRTGCSLHHPAPPGRAGRDGRRARFRGA